MKLTIFKLSSLVKSKHYFIFIIFFIFNNCNNNTSIKKDSIYFNRLEKNLNKKQVISITNLIKEFDIELIKKYPAINKPEKKVLKLLTDLISYYEKQDYNSIREEFKFIVPHLESIKNNGLMKEIWVNKDANYRPIDSVKSWMDSIQKKERRSIYIEDITTIYLNKNTILITDTIVKVSSIRTNSKYNLKYTQNFNGLFYYAIYKASLDSDSEIKNYISNRIITSDIVPIVPLKAINILFKNETNKLLKILLLFEYVIPVYLNDIYFNLDSNKK